VVRNIAVGECLFSPCCGRYNNIAALPDYLIGADYIRFHIADGHYRGKTIATFTAGADIDVYIMKHKNSRSHLYGWTRVEKDFPVQPIHYFKGGADVYKKSYKKGEKVVIPSSRIKGLGFGNLVFVQYALSNYIRVVSPVPGKKLIPMSMEQLKAVMLKDIGDTMKWYVRTGHDTEWTYIGEGFTSWLEVPDTEHRMCLYLKVEVWNEDNELVAATIVHYWIVKSFEVRPRCHYHPCYMNIHRRKK
jgi:hypothetical protein